VVGLLTSVNVLIFERDEQRSDVGPFGLVIMTAVQPEEHCSNQA